MHAHCLLPSVSVRTPYRNPSSKEWASSLGVTEASLKLVLDRGARARSHLVQGWSNLVMSFVHKYRALLSESELKDLAVEGKACFIYVCTSLSIRKVMSARSVIAINQSLQAM